MIKIVAIVAIIVFIVYGEILISKEDNEFFKEFGFYPSHEGWD